jgi:hypothetical protein
MKFWKIILTFLYDLYSDIVMMKTDYVNHVTSVTSLCIASLNNQARGPVILERNGNTASSVLEALGCHVTQQHL